MSDEKYSTNITGRNINIGSYVQGSHNKISTGSSGGDGNAPDSQPKIRANMFISYRRGPSRALVEALHKNLSPYFEDPDKQIFLDVKSLGGGTFPDQLRQAVRRADFFLSIISPGTFDRILEPEDWVRKEIAEAIAVGCVIIPVLEEDTPFPSNLPLEIESLTKWNGTRLRYEMFEESVKLLVDRRIRPALKR